MLTRYLIGLFAGVVVTFTLFYIMQSLINSDKSAFTDAPTGKLVDFVRLPEEQELQRKVRKPPPPPPPDEPPPDQPRPDFDNAEVTGYTDIGAVNVDFNANIDAGGGFSSDGEYLPIVKVAPVYPRRALSRGIEGYVLLEFTVTKTGAVKDPVVIEAKPPGIFDRAAMNAALKFKYKPKVVNGEPIDVPGVRNRITFELTN